MSAIAMAKRENGVCQGSLQKTITISGSKTPNSSSGGSRSNFFFGRQSSGSSQSSLPSPETTQGTYSFLVGVKLTCHESVTSMWNGDHPLACYSLVGVSPVSDDPTAFRAVTDKGTHLLCSVPTKACRNVWLSALNAGLEYQLSGGSGDSSSIPVLPPIQPEFPRGKGKQKAGPMRYCHSCGKVELNRSSDSPAYYGVPMPQYGMEERVDLCERCHLAQGLLEHCYWIEELYATHHSEMDAMLEARRLVLKKLSEAPKRKQQSATDGENESGENTELTEPTESYDADSDRDATGRLLPKSHTLRLEPISNQVLGLALESSRGVALQRLSPTLRSLCLEFQQGMIGVLEFLELLEAAIGIRDPAMADLKKQAFRMAGDMGTALKLLYEQCLPACETPGSSAKGASESPSKRPSNFGGSSNLESTELLQCILEFFLDLVVEEDELNTLAFFWPQISNIHLQMLPPRDTLSLQKIEVLEDFLLTVASKHSIHLAIELVWSHTADLEDALSGSYNGSTTTFCGRRKSSVLRFLCELESLLFDFDTGWGGGSVTVGRFLSPSNHQMDLLKMSIARIQKCRLATEHDRLSRSHRLNKLQSTHPSSPSASPTANQSPELLAMEAVRVANNADYLSSHLAFTKRLCDVAEKLRFLPVNERKGALSTELAKLNASGTMGGDPTNVTKEAHEGHTRVVRIPVMEGHVFRSKARTPVLLLVETIEEGAVIVEEKKEEKEEVSPTANTTSDSNGTSSQNPFRKNEDDTKAEETSSPIEKKEESEETSLNDRAERTLIPNASMDSWEAAEEGNRDDSPPEADVAGEDSNDISEAKNEAEEDALNQSVDQEAVILTPPPPPTTPISSMPKVDDKKVGFEDMEVPELTIATPRKHCLSTDTAGSLLSESGHIPRHALRRFDSPKMKPKIITPTADKTLVESLMTGVIAKQLHLPNLVTVTSLNEDNSDKSSEISDKESVNLPEGEEQELAQADSTEEEEEEPQQTATTPNYSKMKNLGNWNAQEQANSLHKTGGTRREVLTAIMTRGMSGSHVIAQQAATGAKRHLQDLERRVAVEALLTGGDPTVAQSSPGKDDSRKELLNLGIESSVSKEDLSKAPKSDDDETMEAVRLLLIQYRVSKSSGSGNYAEISVSPNTKSPSPLKENRTIMHNGQEFPEIEAGSVDSRLVGCGMLPPAVLQALTLWKGEMISNSELLELVKKDLEFEKNLKAVELNTDKLNEDSAFWGRFAFGERWAEKRSRIAHSSPDSKFPGWNLTGIIVKSNDDLRQESFVMQLIELCHEAFQEAELELWLLPYRIISTGRSTGILGLIRNAMSFDGLKKRPGYGTGGIRGHLQRMTEHEANPGEALQMAQKNFVRSLAAYSLLSYMFQFKDRHNGNIMLDTDGHVIHIDFGFVFGIAPGGNFSLEMATPFKLTEEMIEVMDGLRSSLFSEFVTLFCCGFLALQAHYDTFVTLVEVTSRGSTFPCFDGRDTADIINKMEERFCPDLSQEESVAHVLDVIKEAVGSYGTKQYDYFQYMSQGIAT